MINTINQITVINICSLFQFPLNFLLPGELARVCKNTAVPRLAKDAYSRYTSGWHCCLWLDGFYFEYLGLVSSRQQNPHALCVCVCRTSFFKLNVGVVWGCVCLHLRWVYYWSASGVWWRDEEGINQRARIVQREGSGVGYRESNKRQQNCH